MTAITSFAGAIDQLRHNQVILPENAQKSVIVLGAGPAGLIRAIESVMQGHRTTVVERRASDALGRCNTVALKSETIDLLKQNGAYQSLVEEGKIFPPNTFGNISVRLTDLELALKRVLTELSVLNAVTFRYNAHVTNIDIDESTEKALLSFNTTKIVEIDIDEATEKTCYSHITNEILEPADVIVNCEGAHSSTNNLLNNYRIEVLPKVPVIAAIFEDDRPKITNISSFFTYVTKSIAQIAQSIYYYTIFFFRFTFMNERFSSEHRNIAGSLILKTPGQNYVGCGFSAQKSEELRELEKAVRQKRTAVEKAEQSGLPAEELKKELKKAEDGYHSFATYWINLSFCAANFFTGLVKIYLYFSGNKAQGKARFDNASLLPLKDFRMVEIGADKAANTCQMVGKSMVLIAGDALATVDPTTGQGCNTALQTVELFKAVLDGLQHVNSPRALLQTYEIRSRNRVDDIHAESRTLRQIYRPDALSPTLHSI